MAQISVDIDAVLEANQYLIRGLPDLLDAQKQILSMNNNLSQEFRNRRGIQEQINSIGSELDSLTNRIHKIVGSVNAAMSTYAAVEEDLVQNARRLGKTTRSVNEALFEDIEENSKIKRKADIKSAEKKRNYAKPIAVSTVLSPDITKRSQAKRNCNQTNHQEIEISRPINLRSSDPNRHNFVKKQPVGNIILLI